MMNQLSELEDAQVNELQSAIIAEFETVETEEASSQTVDAMTSLADMLDGVRGELKQREAATLELAARATEAAARVYGESDKSEEGMPSDESETVPIPESEAAMQKDKVDEPAAEEVAPVAPEAPAAEADAPATPAPEEAPASEDEDEKEKKAMSEASTEVKKTSELSTEEVTAPVEAEVAEVAAEEAVAEVAEAEAEPDGEAAENGASDEDASVDEDAEAEASVEPDATAEASVDVPAEAEASTAESTEEPTQPAAELSAQETMEAPVTASANAENLDIEVPADRRMETKESYAPVAITAGADIPGYTAGSSLDSMSTVAEAMAKRIHSLRRVNGGDGEQHIVASVTTTFPEARTLDSDAESNWAKINEVVSPEAITAAGGHVAPFEARYEIFGFGTTARPVRDALPRFQADRGGIRFITPPILEDYEDATGVWTAANDAAGSPSPSSKASLTVTAAGEVSVATDAVTLQMQFGNLATRAYPELIVRHNELGLIQHAREAEVQILSRIGTLSTAVTTSSLLGFGRDFLVQLGRAATAYRSRHRLEVDTSLRVIMPSWVKDAMAADLTLSMPGDSTLNAYAEIDGYIAARGIQVSYTLDGSVFGTQGATALLEFSDTFVWYLFAEGTFLLLDGGTLDLGIIRDSTLVGTNDYKMFIETFEGVAKVGIESLAITSTINVNGAAAALRDTLGGVAAAVVEY
jgi:hypothetical protein